MKNIIFGVIGNMGPEADTLFQHIVINEEISKGVLKDQDHMGMVVVKNPDIPDRSEAINEGGTDPVPEILASVKLLERNNVQFAVMTCNTAHFFRERVQEQTDVYLVDMLKATTDLIKANNPKAVVGVLCTTGTYNSGIYDTYLKQADIKFFKPDQETQERDVHSAIYGEKTGKKTPSGLDIRAPHGIKSGTLEQNVPLLAEVIQKLKDQGVNTIVLGCTELPLVRNLLENSFTDMSFIDPMEAVAARVVSLYKRAQDKYSENSAKNLGSSLTVHQLDTDDKAVEYIAAKASKAQ
ncbi:aspartate/glutamate racemase family protein [Shewanella donghaensis]|uniref:aspartate/glutamate racemase family protein n=1 Tax=Shewanella donghaensis TaxID=238836 RepID=UPI001181E029|nr:amino acid racemase [Shewanella donghaensis]